MIDVPASHQLAFKATIPRLKLKGGDYLIWVAVCSDREKEEVLTQSYLPLQIKEARSPRPEEGVFWNSAEWEVDRVGEIRANGRS